MQRAPSPSPDAAPGGSAGSAARSDPIAPALAVGLAIGVLLALVNVYMGLKTGWWDSGSITASILAFPLLSAFARARRRRAGLLETNLAQTTAAAVGAAPAAAGLLGAVPALAEMGRAPPALLLVPWGLALGILGVLLALALRRRLVEEERLPFPTGVATAHVVRAVHGGEAGAGRTLLGAGVASAALALLRDAAARLPAATALPGSLAGFPAADYGLGLAWSPMMAGAGLVAGLRSGLGALAGAALAWGLVAPALVRAGLVAAPAYAPLVAWLAWPGVGLMLGSACVALAAQRRAFGGAARDLSALSGGGRVAGVAAAVAAVAIAVVIATGAALFALAPWQAALALAAGAVLATVCGRAAGQTDMAPMGELGQLSQAAAGLLPGAAPAASVGVGSVTAGAAAQTAVALWSLKAGRELGAAPRQQAVGLVAGAVVGAAAAVPAYALLARAHGVGGEALPAPGAVPWRALAEATAGGLASVPRGAAAAAVVAFVAGVVLELLARTRAGRRLPAPGALGMGFLLPASYAAAIAAGAIAGAIWRRARPASAEALAPVAGAGAIAGESLAGVAAAAIATLRG